VVGPIPSTWAIPAKNARAFALMPGLWQLRLPTPWEGLPATNAFVLERDDGAVTLVDCGGGGHPSVWEALVGALGEAGWAIADVRLLAATHYHSDHVGMAPRVVRESRCRVAGHPATGHAYDAWRSAARVYEHRVELARRDGVPEELWPAFGTTDEELTGYDGPIAPDDLLVEGATIESTLGTWDVIETPGHSPSHVCLFQRDHGLLLAGDLIAPAFVPYFDIGYTPDPAAETIASLRAVAELGARTGFPGHGRAIQDVQAVIGDHLDGIERMLSAHASALDAGPASAYEVVRRLHPDTVDAIPLVWRWCEATASLHHLALRGRVGRTERNDGTILYAARASMVAPRRDGSSTP
jgi:glyoxylase-like metal-dependent hydrolase (beta-lactamase superfamily II)